MKTIKFIKQRGDDAEGSIAKKADKIADNLIAKKYAVEVKEEAPAKTEKTKGKK